MFAGSAIFGVAGRPDLFCTGLQGTTKGTAIIAAQLAGKAILAGVFFRKIEALLRSEYFSFNSWNDNKRQRADLTTNVYSHIKYLIHCRPLLDISSVGK
ncbi:MAG: hypothetical protein ABF292_06255 [Desulfobacterales bacterium]